MNARCHHIVRNTRRLPPSYFADAQDHTISAASENLERSEQSGADHREVSGESGAAVHSPERAQQLHAARTIFGKQS